MAGRLWPLRAVHDPHGLAQRRYLLHLRRARRRFRLEGRLQPDGSRFKVPQMGWNRVDIARPHPMWEGIASGRHFYFVHSFYAEPADRRDVAATTQYGDDFACALARDTIFATQFHPEKSAADGIRLYRNFLTWFP